MIATMPQFEPLLKGPTPTFDSASRRVNFKRFLNALRASFNSWAEAAPSGGIADSDVGIVFSRMSGCGEFYYVQAGFTARPMQILSDERPRREHGECGKDDLPSFSGK